MKKSVVSIKAMLKIAFYIEKKSVIICVVYNLIKQLMNVFYGVYFIRMILAGLETKQSFVHILVIILFMFVINVLFGRFDQYYKNIYLPIFKLKVDSYINEEIMRKANSIPYEEATSSSELDKYNRVIKNSSKMVMQAYQSFGLVCGLIEAFVMVLFYIINVDVFAIVLSGFPLLYSFFLAEKSAELEYDLNKKVSSLTRKKEYARRVYYLRDYTAEMRTTKIDRIMREIYQEGFRRTVDTYKKDGKKITLIAFFELLLGDAVSMVLPLVYVIIRMLCGTQYLMGDFMGITQAITIFSSDVEWLLDTALELKTASLYISDYMDYLAREEHQAEKVKKIDVTKGFHIAFEHAQYRYPGAPEDVGGEGPAVNGMAADITVIVPAEGLAHGGGNFSFRLQACLGNLEPAHHVPGQALHVHHRGEKPGVAYVSFPAGQKAEIGPHADGEKADAGPVAFGVVQDSGQIPDANRRLTANGAVFSVPVLRQVKAQNLAMRERLCQEAEGDVRFAGLGPVDGHDHPLRGGAPESRGNLTDLKELRVHSGTSFRVSPDRIS